MNKENTSYEFYLPEDVCDQFVGRKFIAISEHTGAEIKGIVHSIHQGHNITKINNYFKEGTYSELNLYVRSTMGNLYDFHRCSFEHTFTLTAEQADKAYSDNKFIL